MVPNNQHTLGTTGIEHTCYNQHTLGTTGIEHSCYNQHNGKIGKYSAEGKCRDLAVLAPNYISTENKLRR